MAPVVISTLDRNGHRAPDGYAEQSDGGRAGAGHLAGLINVGDTAANGSRSGLDWLSI